MDHWIALLLTPLAFWVVLSGVDDCFIAVAAAIAWIRMTLARGRQDRQSAWYSPNDEDLAASPVRHMAVFVAAWREHRVIQSMLDHNVTRLRYPRFDFFVGAYPNDVQTLAAVREAMKRHPSVHLAVCPHDGPTSKADCLNWIYQRMILYEEEHGVHFDMIITHDAEDIIDPDALLWINYYAQWNDMIQIPVLALPTPPGEITHGIYCDEFCEYQHKDMMARSLLGGFIPSNGVGTGYSRHALGMLAAAHSNRVFEPGCLTEDYENGCRVALLGLRQKFIPVHIRDGRAIATREYFPRKLRGAVRQRTRWVTGIGLQSWEYHTWRQTLRYLYWFWRDRKSLAGNLIGPLANLLFVYGVVTLAWANHTHTVWGLGREASGLAGAAVVGLWLQFFHTSVRTACCARVYGWRFAALAPVRVVAANWINCFATCGAMWNYAMAKMHGRALRWAKTDHVYPSRTALMTERKKLGEILTSGQWITESELAGALASKPAGRRLGEHLMMLGMITEKDVYAALALQNNLPMGKPEPSSVSLPVTRALPAAVAKKWRILPFRIVAGELYMAGAELPGDEMQREIRRFSSLEIRFHLVTPTDYAELALKYLG